MNDLNTLRQLRHTNPFREATSTELIDDPNRYSQMFSHEILVNETLEVFEKSNTVLTGPQGTGKTMILCLFQHNFLSACLENGSTQPILRSIKPFISISINLVRSCFHIFGRRSISKAMPHLSGGEELDAMGAADFINHWLFLV